MERLLRRRPSRSDGEKRPYNRSGRPAQVASRRAATHCTSPLKPLFHSLT